MSSRTGTTGFLVALAVCLLVVACASDPTTGSIQVDGEPV